MINYEIYAKKPNGDRISVVTDELDLETTIKANDASTLTLLLDCCSNSLDDFPEDTRLEICCSCECSTETFLLGNSPFFVERVEKCESGTGCNIKITATSATGLLSRRIIPYKSDAAKGKAENEDAAALLRRLFNQNGGDPAQTGNYNQATDATRAWNGCITMCPEAAAVTAPAYSGQFGGTNLLTAMQNIAAASEAKGVKLYFGIFQKECCSNQLEFCIKTQQMGEDTGAILSPDNESIGDYCIAIDEKGTANRVYASGENNSYAIASASDLATQLTDDCFALRESSTSAGSNSGSNGAQDAANADLAKLSKNLQFDGTAAEGDSFRFGCDYNFGDRVKVVADGYEFFANIDSLHFRQNGNQQTIEPGISSSSNRTASGTVQTLVKSIQQLQKEIDRLKSLI